MKRNVMFLAAMYAVTAAVCAQEKPAISGATSSSTSINLQLAGAVRVLLDGVTVGKAKCDAAGNLYVRVMTAEQSRIHHGISQIPIEKIAPDGTIAATYRATDAATDISAKDIFVSEEGGVYQVGWIPDGTIYVVEFSTDGTMRKKVQLGATGVIPYALAVFKSGELLLSGVKGSDNRTPYTAVFRADGGLIKQIYEPEDEDSRHKAATGEAYVSESGSGNTFVWRGDVAAGSDGNVYLLRASSPGLVYVISPKGEVIRKLRIDPPSSGLVAGMIRPMPGKLAISFLYDGRRDGMTRVVDFEGNPIVDHFSDDVRINPGLPGCYGADGFTFLSWGDGHLWYLHKTKPK